MIALCNVFNSYDILQVSSSNENSFEHAKHDWSDHSYLNGSILPPLIFFTIFDQCEVHLNKQCIGYYDLDHIEKDSHKAFYNLRLYDKDVLPKNFDFHFEKFNMNEKSRKFFLSGPRVFFDKKMIIDPK